MKISLIGMPSSGKTTLSSALAGDIGYKAIDLDHMVELKEGESLINTLEKKGGNYFLNIEYSFLLNIKPEENVVISTAGSIIYHEDAMKWLKVNTKIFLINTELETIKNRLEIMPKAIVGLKEKGLDKLYIERLPIYRKWADFEISTKNKTIPQIIEEMKLMIK